MDLDKQSILEEETHAPVGTVPMFPLHGLLVLGSDHTQLLSPSKANKK